MLEKLPSEWESEAIPLVEKDTCLLDMNIRFLSIKRDLIARKEVREILCFTFSGNQ